MRQRRAETLDDLIRLNPDFRSPEGHLLYARALETEGNADKALEEYKVLAQSYPGAEAAARYAQLLKRAGPARRIAEGWRASCWTARASLPRIIVARRKSGWTLRRNSRAADRSV